MGDRRMSLGSLVCQNLLREQKCGHGTHVNRLPCLSDTMMIGHAPAQRSLKTH